MKGQL